MVVVVVNRTCPLLLVWISLWMLSIVVSSLSLTGALNRSNHRRGPYPSSSSSSSHHSSSILQAGSSPLDNENETKNNVNDIHDETTATNSAGTAIVPMLPKIIDNVPDHCGVRPSRNNYRTVPVIKDLARWTWRRRQFVLTLLHWNDPLKPVDSCINLECLWWKALSTTNRQSPCYDDYTYDLLPRPGRTILKALRRLHPRWIHALLEIRMAYLNKAVAQVMNDDDNDDNSDHIYNQRPVRIISLGAGYDTRLIRMLNDDDDDGVSRRVIECYEFDLPASVESKKKLIQERLVQRQVKKGRPDLKLPTMIGLDLNDTVEFEKKLKEICCRKRPDDADLQTIFVVEGVIMYLDKGKAEAALQACANACSTSNVHSSLCFADRFFENFNVDPTPIQERLRSLGWELIEWAPNANANARHMGIARSLSRPSE
jgi:O-methyltransferase involved in polyketide biosynthesis